MAGQNKERDQPGKGRDRPGKGRDQGKERGAWI